MSSFTERSLPRAKRLRYIVPSMVSVLRVCLATAMIEAIAQWPDFTGTVAWVGIPLVFGLDAVDGVVARWLRVPTLIGSFVDIAADRAVEFIFLRHFIGAGVVPWWFGAVFYGRILITDGCRVLAFGMKQVLATGIVLPEGLRGFVLSKTSRTAYAALKGIFFGVLLLGRHSRNSSLSTFELTLMFTVLAFSILRASPILITYVPRWRELTLAKLITYIRSEVDDVAPRSTKIVSCLQFASDIGLATWILLIAWR